VAPVIAALARDAQRLRDARWRANVEAALDFARRAQSDFERESAIGAARRLLAEALRRQQLELELLPGGAR
jgi:hypothetical protein